MADNVIELLVLISYQGHTGFSINYLISLFNKLVKYKTLSPLTFKEDEWQQSYNCYQNIRKSSIFKDDYGISDIDAFRLSPKGSYYYDKKQWKENNSGVAWSTTVYEHNDNILTGCYFNRCYIETKENYTPIDTIYLDGIEIEYSKSNWLMCATSEEIKKLEKYYVLNWKSNPELVGVNVTDCETLNKIL